MQAPTSTTRWAIVATSITLYIVSLCLPAIRFMSYTTFSNGSPSAPVMQGPLSHSGITMLFSSVLGLLMLNFAFFANPLLLATWICVGIGRFRAAVWTGALSLLFALETFQLLRQTFPEDEGGVRVSHMLYPQAGWYVWIASILLPLIAALAWRRHQLPPMPIAPPPTHS